MFSKTHLNKYEYRILEQRIKYYIAIEIFVLKENAFKNIT